MRPVSIILACVLTSLLLGCGSGRGASSYLYEEGPGEPRLRNSEIRMETERFRQGGPGPDVRTISCSEGRIVARFESPARRQEGEAALPGTVQATAEAVKKEKGVDVEYLVGTMIEVPRAALTAGAPRRLIRKLDADPALAEAWSWSAGAEGAWREKSSRLRTISRQRKAWLTITS